MKHLASSIDVILLELQRDSAADDLGISRDEDRAKAKATILADLLEILEDDDYNKMPVMVAKIRNDCKVELRQKLRSYFNHE